MRLAVAFLAGPTRYAGAGIAEVNCSEAREIPRLAAIDRRERP